MGKPGPNATALERRSVYKCMADTLENDIEGNGSGIIYNDLDGNALEGPALRRRLRAARQVLAVLRKRSK